MSTERRGMVVTGDLPLGIDHLPFRVYFAVLVNVAERFSYYGLTIPFQNYVQNSYGSVAHERPGVLGLGQTAATAINNAFFTFQTIAALCGAVGADGWLGRYNLLVISSLVYLFGTLLLVLVSIPAAIEHGAAPAGFTVSLILIAAGSGAFQSTVSAFIGDQYVREGRGPVTRKNGKMYMPDRDLTLQFIYNLNYWGLNIGAISGIASTFLELHYGFWAAFLLPLSGLWIAPATLILGRKHFICQRPQENALLGKGKVFWRIVVKSIRRKSRDASEEDSEPSSRPLQDDDIGDVKQTLYICRVLAIFILVYVCVGQSSNNFIAQAGQMQTNGLPNDLIWYFNPILVVVLLPFVQWLLSNMTNLFHVRFGPMMRMIIGCFFFALSMAFAAIVQQLIYNVGPCYRYPTECSIAEGGPNNISVWIQFPSYVLIAFGEILGITTAYKFAYDTAPESMKSLVQGVLLATQGIGALIDLAISPTARNPKLVIMYAVIAGIMFVATIIFTAKFWKDDGVITLDSPDYEAEEEK
ncbi:POT family-domain-containing protein [Xylaria bambusicola]|uniref:POT family-domain-containing protein n=1 Tax=Xylaria bambusicola TaxID=326684 RepID=UPI00200723C7|nr:POT family-domain-containing protein [Xylaria bambusicola]KAI0508576.1 POT family-domain-containing protein [Xylaria bambusicola]